MVMKRFVQLGVISSIACAAVVSSSAAFASLSTQHAETFNNRMLSSVPVAVQVAAAGVTGEFMAAEAPTTGMVRVVTENGQRYLEFDAAFSTTDQAPDLHVLLDTTANPPSSYTTFGSYINLGKLRTVSGTQRYPIPDVIDLANYHSVVIWCRMANATIGYAMLH